jgi:predicted nucleotidyltransferase
VNEFQTKIRKQFQELLEPFQEVLSAWEGGSAATGYWDEYSDLDLQIIVQDEFVEESFKIVEKFLGKEYGILQKFRIPEPNWHGHSQCFYLIDKCPETFYIDFFVEKESAGNRFLEPDRHGKAIIWFDKNDLVNGEYTPPEVTYQKCRDFFERINIYIPFCFLDAQKQIYRGNKIDAFAMYYSLLNRIIALMNIKYRPAKHDFGMRYLHRDFPEAEQELIERLLYNKSLEELQVNLNNLKDIYPKLLKDIRHRIHELESD